MKQLTNPQNSGQMCEDILDLLPAYVLGATDPDETAFVKANLDSCPEATAQIPDYQRLVDEMRASVPQVMPALDFEDRLMSRIAGTQAPAISVAPRPKTLRWGLIAAVAAILLLGLMNVYWITRINNLAETNAELMTQLQQPESAVLASLASMQWRRLASEQDPNVLALVVWQGDDGFLYTLDMPSLPPDQVYQLWLVESDNHHISAGTFRVDERGRGTLHFFAPESIGDFARLGITTEPAGGGNEPSTGPVVRGDV